RAEEALKESEERFRVAQEFSPDGFTILRPVRDDQGLIVDFIWIYENETIARLNGTDSKAVVGKRLLDMFPGHRGSQFFEAYQQVADTGKSRIMESSYQGESISTLTWFRTVIFSMGVDIAILAQNITERKIAEEAIKISEDKFRKVFSTSPDSININRLDDGMYVAINNGFTQSTGYTEEDVEGKTSKELNIWDNSDDRKKLIEGLKTDGIVKNLEARFRKKNGDVNFGLMSASVIDLNGIPHIISITRDISERKKAEEIIRESERKFRETVENLQEGYYKCTIDGILIEHNPAFCEILGFESDNDLSGVKLPDFWQNPEDREVYLKEMEKEGYIKNYTVNAKKTNGEKMYILVNSHLLKDTEDKYIGIEGTIVDLTERKQAEEALKASEVKYKNLIETMPEGFYRSTPEGYFVDVNPAIVKMLGFENKEELMKINIPDELYFSRDERIDGVNYNIDFVPDTEIYRLKKKDGSEIW
ncbi:MAG: PAS domain S-box protein, partial [Ignavibacteriae bacterium]|nr:PAS domain S-box protein [Ignavibacteriota bacterium]